MSMGAYGRQPPPVPPRRKVPIGITLNEYNQNQKHSDNRRDDDVNSSVVSGAGGGLKAARQISQNVLLTSRSEPNIVAQEMKKNGDRNEKESIPDSIIGVGVEIKGTVAFKR